MTGGHGVARVIKLSLKINIIVLFRAPVDGSEPHFYDFKQMFIVIKYLSSEIFQGASANNLTEIPGPHHSPSLSSVYARFVVIKAE